MKTRVCLGLWMGCWLAGMLHGQPATVAAYHGLSDASAVIALDERHFAVGDDEDNLIRVYRVGGSGRPLQTLELSRFLQVDWRSPEVDIEGAARLGGRIYWITSHGRNAKGEWRASRQRLFATEVNHSQGYPRLAPVGQPYQYLLQDLLQDVRLAALPLHAAARLAPKSAGGLNIEGLGASPEGHLLVGFRNPLIEGKALLVPVLNPAGIVAGQSARLGGPILLDLGGQGIRSLADWHGQYFLVGGATGDGGRSRLFSWDGQAEAARVLPEVEMAGFNPESVAVARYGGADHLLLISDDGNLKVGGRPQKKIPDPNLRRFRAWFSPLTLPGGQGVRWPAPADE